MIFYLAFIWVEIKQLWDAGLHDYCFDHWNILDFITNSLYLCTFALRFVAWYQVRIYVCIMKALLGSVFAVKKGLRNVTDVV